ncbi:MAG: ATP-binding protein, partial [Spongiibacteraceae bacterium]|nr:ATP-binding protein [Spongiibacteraceae bacterium]
MYLKRSITVNWGNLPAQELEFGPVNLFSGGNGSGKTTAADALQTLMTAAHDNLFNYNPGQDETTQRGRGGKQVRTLASYVLGCDDGAFARPWSTDGYIAGVFHPTQGETAEPFTAVIGVRAHLDRAGAAAQARQDELLLMIVAGEMLSLSHFLRDYKDGRHITPVTELPDLLRREFGKQAVEVYDKKGSYLARLYGALRGKRDAVSSREAKNAARTFANFMAYKPVKSIDQFVAEEVLEPRDMGDTVRRIRDLLRTVHGMEQEAARLRASVAQLETARGHADSYVELWVERTALGYGAAAQAYAHNQRDYLAAKDEQQRLRQEQAALEEEQQLTHQRLQAAQQELVELRARMLGIPALRTRDELERERVRLEEALRAGVKPLLEQEQQRQTNLKAVRAIRAALAAESLELVLPEFAARGWREATRELLASADQPLPDLNQLLARDWIDLAPLDAGLDQIRLQQQLHNRIAELLHGQPGADNTLALRARRLLDERTREVQAVERQVAQTERQIAALESQRVSYPADVEAAVQAIRQQCPQADPRVLCDYVEVSDPEWQMAIEGYIGGARFGILVEPEFEAEAIRIVRRLSGSRNRARVIQGEQARRDAEKQNLPAGSIIEVICFHHRIAEHYLRASYGNVVRVQDAQTLRRTRRGVTADGMGSGNYALFRCDLADSELVFGQSARERNLRAQQQALSALHDKLTQTVRDRDQIAEVVARLACFHPLDHAAAASRLLDLQRQLRDVEQQLEELDLDAHRDLQDDEARVQARYNELQALEGTLNKRAGSLEEQRRSADARIRHFADQSDALLEKREQAEEQLFAAARKMPGIDAEARIGGIDARLEQSHVDIDFIEQEIALTSELSHTAVALERAVRDY